MYTAITDLEFSTFVFFQDQHVQRIPQPLEHCRNSRSDERKRAKAVASDRQSSPPLRNDAKWPVRRRRVRKSTAKTRMFVISKDHPNEKKKNVIQPTKRFRASGSRATLLGNGCIPHTLKTLSLALWSEYTSAKIKTERMFTEHAKFLVRRISSLMHIH